MSWLLIAALLIITLTVVCYFFVSSDHVAPVTVYTENDPAIIGDRFCIMTATELISALQLEPVITNLQNSLSFSDDAWNKDALPFIHQFLEFIQRLPASESHHHAGDGGLARHTLDVAILALTASQANSWPPGAKTEDIARLTAAWRYGIMLAAMLHDIGKTMTGFHITLYSGAKDIKGYQWFPDAAGAMRETGARYYHVGFPEKKEDYSKHTQLAWMFFQQLVPATTRTWLTKADATLMETLRNYLSAKAESDKEKAAFAKIIRVADQVSTARDLKHGSRQRFSSARLKPLVEVIIDTLREMLAQKGAFYSIGHTAGGHLFRQEQFVYMTCPKVIDILRQYLKDTESLYTKILPDNIRIYDTLLESNAIKAAPYDEHKSIWLITTKFVKNDGQTKNEPFTVLCFQVETLFLDANNAPPEYQGELIVHQTLVKEIKEADLQYAPETETMAQETAVKREQQVNQKPTPEPPKSRLNSSGRTGSPNIIASPDDLLSMAFTQEDDVIEAAKESVESEHSQPDNPKKTEKPKIGMSLNANLDKLKSLKQYQNMSVVSKSSVPESTVAKTKEEPAEEDVTESVREYAAKEVAKLPVSAPNAIFVNKQSAYDNIGTRPQKTEDPIQANLYEQGNRFLHFLANGLANGSLNYNEGNALVHFVSAGMLLVTPEIFAKCTGVPFDRKDKGNESVMMQRGFEYMAIHEKCQSSKKNWGKTAHWTVIRANEEDGRRLFSAYLIPEQNLHRVIQPASRPSNNPLIKLLESPLETANQ